MAYLKKSLPSVKIKCCALFILIFCILTAITFRQPFKIDGDAVEYLIQTQAIALDYSIAIDSAKRQEYWNKTSPFSLRLGPTKLKPGKLSEASQAGGGFGGLYPDSSGDFRYYHFWGYSLAVAPFYWAIHKTLGAGPAEYEAFRLANVFFLTTLIFSIFRIYKNILAILLCVLALLSPLASYLSWMHPEVFQFSLIALAFILVEFGKNCRLFAPIFLGIAAAQNCPTLLWFPALFWLSRPSGSGGYSFKQAIPWAVGIILALSSPLYYFLYFDTWSLIKSLGLASTSYLSLERTWYMFVGIFGGALWCFPVHFFFVPIWATRVGLLKTVFILFTMAAVTYLTTANPSVHSSQIGTSRYLLWASAPLFALALSLKSNFWKMQLREKFFLISGLLLSFTTILAFKLYFLPAAEILKFSELTKCRRLRVMANISLNEDPEVIVEKFFSGEELDRPWKFNKIYQIDAGSYGRLIIIPKRILPKIKELSLIQNLEEKNNSFLGSYKIGWINETIVNSPLVVTKDLSACSPVSDL